MPGNVAEQSSPSIRAASAALLAAGDDLPPVLQPPGALEEALAHYYAHTSDDELAQRQSADVAAALLSHVRTAAEREAGGTIVRVHAAAGSSRRSIVEVVTDDMPFLVDSVTAEITRQGLGIHLLLHPQLDVRRAESGALTGFCAPGELDADCGRESWIHVEVDRLDDAGSRQRLADAIARVLADVRAAVRDWAPMRTKALELADELRDAPPAVLDRDELHTAERFLRWLADDRFTFLGYREYDLVTEDGEDVLTARPGTGLGVLSDSRDRPRTPARRLSGPVREKAREPRALVITKANARATVHRPAYLDYVGVKTFDAEGRVVGERRFLGLLTSSAYTESVRRVPVVAEKVAAVMARAGFSASGHSAKDLLTVLETFPRDELLQAPVGDIFKNAIAVLRLQERRRTRLFLRQDDYRRFMSCLIFLPRDRYSTQVGAEMERVLQEAFDAESVEHTLAVSESVLARLHVVVRARPGQELPQVDPAELEAALVRASRSWEDDFADAARDVLGEDEGAALVRRWVRGVPEAYRVDVTPFTAVVELLRLDEVLKAVTDGDETPQLALHEPEESEAGIWRLIFYRAAPVTLSTVLPLLGDLGVEVTDEHPHTLHRADGPTAWVYDFGFRLPAELQRPGADLESLQELFTGAFAAAWSGQAESDSLSRLVLAAQLSWRQVAIVRALVRYLRQVGLPYSLDYVAGTLLANTGATRLLVRLFEARFAPARSLDATERQETVAAVLEEANGALDDVDGLDADRILRALMSVVQSVLRTNAYQAGTDGRSHPYLSFKLDPSGVAGIPEPTPKYEIWVYSPRVEGVHLRFGDVARGGLRWSDRREDFRTEILGLVKAQIVKNAVIVPTGAKGGFVGKQLPDPSVDRDAWWAEGVACYKTFISGLLDVTDNLRTEGEQQVVVPPADVVRYDGDDPYLVVAADKGTATFSDTANAIAREKGFWLGDAFASGGSNGYDHKAMGITARGAWESVRRHFRELGVDPQTTDITVVGVGDMSGDVFGNGMLLSEHIKLVAAFDHRHVFLDPDPDPAASFAERRRLFGLGRSSWADYDRALISPGGGVHSRTAKSIPITPQVADRLGLPEGTTRMSPTDLVRAVLKAPVDLFWNGGIGTYVKASTEEHAEVGDKANDPVRIDGCDLRVRVVGEGGNLGFTQRGRVEAALRGAGGAGVKLNTDAIDNSAGVDCSDHEVNIKILLDHLVADGRLDGDERNATLGRMTDEVARLVLRGNYEQNVLLSVEGASAARLLPAHRRFLDALEESGALDRDLEFLPSNAELERRGREGGGLTVPELSVVTAYAKTSLAGAILASGLPDEEWTSRLLRAYFPSEVVQRFGDRLLEHPLRREIATTVLVNDMVNHSGITFAFRAQEETGAGAADVAHAYVVVRDVFAVQRLTQAVEALDGVVPTSVQARLHVEVQRLLDRAVRWFLHARPEGLDVPAEVQRFRDVLGELAPRVPELLRGAEAEALRAEVEELVGLGVPETDATTWASLLYGFSLLDVTELAEELGRAPEEVAATWYAVSAHHGIDDLLTRISELERSDRWESLARAALRDDLYAALRDLTRAVLVHEAAASEGAEVQVERDPVERVVEWEEANAAAVRRARQTMTEIRSLERADLASLSVALRVLRTVLRTG
ncbi:glutamate dehydrogenase [Kineococcus xinjiangensis]|uniref:Glutamate dehydrogenase n=1 Tax=Kineococcus xinjiangensis TaxID=512762 RepID=A0A2S6ICV2_9ACTN|nr:NAD-glutamate dehydrogenase [Kineococcus xinjiangensis]PPK92031.1 glutamate dehydrogenase [Kineococcus xinjiangensis]